MADEPIPAPPGFVALAAVGRGAMGPLVRARREETGEVVALRLLDEVLADDPGVRRSFLAEAGRVAAVEHPAVARVLDWGEHEGGAWLATEWVQGTSLARLVGAAGALDPSRAAGLVEQLGAGLDAIHGAGLVHGDVRPANVLVETDDGRDRVRLVDFGGARTMAATTLGPRTLGGDLEDPAYLAPERITGAEAGAESDRYALGCLLVLLLTGRPAFTGAGVIDVARAQAEGPRPRPSAMRRGLGPAFDDVVRRALAIDPEDRPSTATALAAEVRAAAGAAPGARPPRAADLPPTDEHPRGPRRGAAPRPDPRPRASARDAGRRGPVPASGTVPADDVAGRPTPPRRPTPPATAAASAGRGRRREAAPDPPTLESPAAEAPAPDTLAEAASAPAGGAGTRGRGVVAPPWRRGGAPGPWSDAASRGAQHTEPVGFGPTAEPAARDAPAPPSDGDAPGGSVPVADPDPPTRVSEPVVEAPDAEAAPAQPAAPTDPARAVSVSVSVSAPDDEGPSVGGPAATPEAVAEAPEAAPAEAPMEPPAASVEAEPAQDETAQAEPGQDPPAPEPAVPALPGIGVALAARAAVRPDRPASAPHPAAPSRVPRAVADLPPTTTGLALAGVLVLVLLVVLGLRGGEEDPGPRTGATTTGRTAASVPAEPSPARVRARAVATLERFAEAYSARDGEALGRTLARDVVRRGQQGGGACASTSGREAVVALYGAQFAGGTGAYAFPGLRASRVDVDGQRARVTNRYEVVGGGSGRVTLRLEPSFGRLRIARIDLPC